MLRRRCRGNIPTTGSTGRVQAFGGTKTRRCKLETRIHPLMSGGLGDYHGKQQNLPSGLRSTLEAIPISDSDSQRLQSAPTPSRILPFLRPFCSHPTVNSYSGSCSIIHYPLENLLNYVWMFGFAVPDCMGQKQ